MSDAPETRPSPVRWMLLGDVSVAVDQVERSLPGQRQRAILAALVLRACQSVSIDELTESVWGEHPPKTARNSIQRFVADIRRTLGDHADRIVTTAEGYRLDAGADEIDTAIMRGHLDAARADIVAGRFEEAAEHCHAAQALRRGTPLGGIGDVGFKHAEASALRELVASVVETGLQIDLDRGLHDQMIERLRRFTEEEEARESAWALLMLGLYRSGRQQEALDTAATLRRRLVDDHGVTPSATILELEVQILNQDPDLDRPAATSEPVATAHGPDIPVPDALARTLTGPIVGRDQELDILTDLVEAAAQGSSRICFVSGEPGIGKTRLLGELTTIARKSGVATLYGRASEDTGLPYSSWSAALHHLIRSAPEVFDDPALDAIRGDLESIVPELGRTTELSASERRADTDPETLRAVLFRSVTHFLDVVSRTQPLAIVLDDMQWGEASSLDLLRHVGRHGTGSFLIVAAYRDTDVGADHDLSQTIGTLLTEPSVSAMQLEGLGRETTSALISNLTGTPPGPTVDALSTTIEAATNGNPFFTTEIIKDLAERSAKGLNTSTLSTVPDSVRVVIGQRVGRLGNPATKALRAASVCGREFDLRTVAAALSIDESELLDRLEGALDASLLAEHPRDNDRFVFSHDLVRQTLYEDLSASRRRRLHAEVAVAMLADNRDGDLASSAAEIAHHLRVAEDRALDAELVRVARLAAQHAARLLAPDDAAQWLTTALEHVDSDDRGADALRADLLMELGSFEREAGRGNYRQTLLEAGRLADRIGATDALIEAALANTRGTQTHVWEVDTERVELLRMALAAIGPEATATRAHLLAGLGSEQWDDERREESARHRSDAIEMARRSGDLSAIVNALARAARPRNAVLSNAQAQRYVEELRPFVDRLGELDPHLAVNLLRTIQAQALRDADVDTVREMSAAIHELAGALPLAICVRASKLTTVLEAGLAGDAAAYEEHAVDAFEHCVEMGDPEAMLVLQAHLFYGRHLAGRIGELAAVASQLYDDDPTNAIYRAVAAIVANDGGDVDRAGEILDGAIADVVRSDDVYEIQSTVFLAEVAGLTNHPSMATLYEALEMHRGQLAGQLQNLNWPMDLTLGLLATGLGRFEVAGKHFDTSMDIARRFEAPWMIAQTQLRHAALLIARRAPGAEPLIADAVATAQAHGYAQLLREADALRSAAQAVTPP